TLFTVLGFFLFMLGMLSLVLSLVGVKLALLTFIDAAGRGLGFLIRLLMVLIGVVMIVVSRSEFDGGTME
ncbi:MAG: hypothetical protein AAGD05_14865, partial [Bacteroidota bacterium]